MLFVELPLILEVATWVPVCCTGLNSGQTLYVATWALVCVCGKSDLGGAKSHRFFERFWAEPNTKQCFQCRVQLGKKETNEGEFYTDQPQLCPSCRQGCTCDHASDETMLKVADESSGLLEAGVVRGHVAP